MILVAWKPQYRAGDPVVVAEIDAHRRIEATWNETGLQLRFYNGEQIKTLSLARDTAEGLLAILETVVNGYTD